MALNRKKSLYRDGGKRLFDFVASGLGLVVLSPLLLLLWLVGLVNFGSPVIFRQRRPGKNNKIFYMIKFRSMTNKTGPDGQLLPDAERLTKYGKFLRASSLDELPELWNVFIGNMSLVGPRPLLERYLERYSPEQKRRHEASPGITGWAQVNGRNAIGWSEKFALDVWYVDNVSFALDLKILWMTAMKVVRRSGISAEGSATMHEFMGSEDTSNSSS